MPNAHTLGNPRFPQALGPVQSWKKVENGLVVHTPSGDVHLLFVRADILRVTLENGLLDLNPYTVVGQPEKCTIEVSETPAELSVVSSALQVTIEKNPYRMVIKDPDGTVLSADEPGLGLMQQGTQTTLYRTLQEGERFIGLGEKTGHLDRRGSGYVNWNTDRFAYGSDTDPLYASIPFFMGIHNHKVYGMYLDNSYRTEFNFGASNDRFSSMSAAAGTFDYYFFAGQNAADILSAYTFLTGRTPLPPAWSIGYQQCRYSYYPQNEVMRVAEKFRDKQIPADVIVLDIHYMDQYKIFSWDKERFPDPKKMIAQLKEMGFEVVVICDPGIKVEKGYEPYESGLKEDIFLKYPDGQPYSGQVWPGWCHFPDFTQAKARTWWKNQLKSYTDLGIKGYWNDMNEIATWGNMLPDNILFDFEEEVGSTLKGRNIYGYQMARSSSEASTELLGQRTFTLTRSAFAGIQRYSALWTGDNVSNDESMMLGVRLVNSLGLSGVAFCGYDVGGFVGNGNPHLFARWMQLGAFSPFFRGHTMINSNSSEPWSYGEEVEEITTNFIRLRYQLLPYLYQAFRVAAESGMPVNRSLAIDYTHDPMVYRHAYEHQYLFGPSLLVAPLESYKHLQKVYLPAGDWYELFSGKHFTGSQEIFNECGIEKLPVYVRGGSLLTMYPKIGDHTSSIGSMLEIHVYAGGSTFETDYYEDDGVSFDYQSEHYYLRKLTHLPEKKQLRIGQAFGSYASAMKKIRVVLHGYEADTVQVNGQPVATSREDYRFIQPISNFDPVIKAEDKNLKNEELTTFILDNQANEMVIDF